MEVTFNWDFVRAGWSFAVGHWSEDKTGLGDFSMFLAFLERRA